MYVSRNRLNKLSNIHTHELWMDKLICIGRFAPQNCVFLSILLIRDFYLCFRNVNWSRVYTYSELEPTSLNIFEEEFISIRKWTGVFGFYLKIILALLTVPWDERGIPGDYCLLGVNQNYKVVKISIRNLFPHLVPLYTFDFTYFLPILDA